VPTVLSFDPRDPIHRSFVLWAATLRGRVCGLTSSSISTASTATSLGHTGEDVEKPLQEVLAEAFDDLFSTATADSSAISASNADEKAEATKTSRTGILAEAEAETGLAASAQVEASPPVAPSANEKASIESIARLLASMGSTGRASMLSALQPEEFEKV
jgi:hypothetical protein